MKLDKFLEPKGLNAYLTLLNVSYILGVKMVSITLSIPKELKQKMDKFEWLNWSALAREAFVKRMKQLEVLEKFEKDFENSKLTEENCIKLGRELKKSMAKTRG